MWHWVNRAGRGPGTDAGSGACGTRVTGSRGPWRRDSRGGESVRRIRQHAGRPGPGKATGYLLTRPYGGCCRTIARPPSASAQTGDYPSAAANLTDAIKLYRDLNDQLGEAGSLSELGALQHATGDYQNATASLARAVELAHDIGERAGEAEALNNLGDLYLDTAALADAQGRYTQALAIAARIDLALEEGRALEGIGRCLLRLGQDADGTAMPRRALALYERIGSVNAKRVAETLRDKG